MRSIRLLRGVLATTLACCAVLVGAMVTSADTSVWHSGAYGSHFLADTAEFPNVRCEYSGFASLNLAYVVVRDPFVYARNRGAGVDSQQVAWYFRVESREGSGPWTTAATSDVQTRTATDGQVANFSPLAKAVPGVAAKRYRVLIFIRWFNGTAIEGRAVHRADWYVWPTIAGMPANESCPGAIG